MPTLRIEPQNPRQVRPEELEILVADLRKRLPDFHIELSSGAAMPAGARGVTWWEVVRCYFLDIPGDIQGAVIAIILEAVIKWARQGFRRRREHGAHKEPPKCVVIHDADGTEVQGWVLLSPRHKLRTVEEARSHSVGSRRGTRTRTRASTRRKKSK